MDALSKEGYERLREVTGRILMWCRLGILLGIIGMVGSEWVDDAVSSFFMFYVGLMVAATAFAIGTMSNISLSDYARDMAWKENRNK